MLKPSRKFHLIAALVLGTAGCLATGPRRTTGSARTPSLVWIDDEVWVIENHDEPVFWSDGSYWRWSGGVWYRSHDHDRGWVTITVIPDRLRRIDRPTRYVRYVAPPEARRQGAPPAHAQAHGVRGNPPGHDGKDKGHDKGDEHGKGGKHK